MKQGNAVNCNNGKHYWDMESGFCVGCGAELQEWDFESRSVKPKQRYTGICECGAQATVNPEHHSRWCPAFVEVK